MLTTEVLPLGSFLLPISWITLWLGMFAGGKAAEKWLPPETGQKAVKWSEGFLFAALIWFIVWRWSPLLWHPLSVLDHPGNLLFVSGSEKGEWLGLGGRLRISGMVFMEKAVFVLECCRCSSDYRTGDGLGLFPSICATGRGDDGSLGDFSTGISRDVPPDSLVYSACLNGCVCFLVESAFTSSAGWNLSLDRGFFWGWIVNRLLF